MLNALICAFHAVSSIPSTTTASFLRSKSSISIAMVALPYSSLSPDSSYATSDRGDAGALLSKLSTRRYYIPLGALALLGVLLLSSGPATVAQTASAARQGILSYIPSSSSPASSITAITPSHGLAYGPADLTAAVANSEAIWQRSKDKRDAFIKSKGGLGKMTPFEYKPKKKPAWRDAQSKSSRFHGRTGLGICEACADYLLLVWSVDCLVCKSQ